MISKKLSTETALVQLTSIADQGVLSNPLNNAGLASKPLALITPRTLQCFLVSIASFNVKTSPLATTGTIPFAHSTAKAIASRSTGCPELD